MAKEQIVKKPIAVTDFFDELYSEMVDGWQQKAKNLRIRRMRKIKDYYDRQ